VALSENKKVTEFSPFWGLSWLFIARSFLLMRLHLIRYFEREHRTGAIVLVEARPKGNG
jgi:hypothetical protein